MPRREITSAELTEALAIAANPHRTAGERARAVRATARHLEHRHPGKTVEIRIPPYIAVQAFDGLRHTRGTPPNTVETDADTWLALVTGAQSWQRAVETGALRASGTRADISEVFPLQVEQVE